MQHLTAIDRDILGFAEYWGARKACWLGAAAEEFERAVRPVAAQFEGLPPQYVSMTNIYFTEWALFERPLIYGLTPLQLYIERAGRALPAASLDRLRQVERTQFFSRFAIVEKDAASCRVHLADVRTGRAYGVVDPVVCSTDRWREGTIAERIACVDGVWRPVGQARLYDRAPAGRSGLDDAGDFGGEGRPRDEPDSYYLQLLRDVIGMDGRFSDTMRLVEVEPEAVPEPAA